MKKYKLESRFFYLSVLSTLLGVFLLPYGALVRLMGAGLACPDWPLCHNQLFPDWGDGIGYEVGHRYVAGSLVILVFIMLVMVLANKSLSRLRGYCMFLFGILLLQSVFGGLTVLWGLSFWTVMVHLVLGHLCLLFLVLVSMHAKDLKNGVHLDTSFKFGEWGWLLLIFFLLLASGGLNSSTMSGYVCRAFPLCEPEAWGFYIDSANKINFGSAFILDTANWQKLIHLSHRFLAIVFFVILTAFLAWILAGSRYKNIRRYLIILWLLVMAETLAGILNAVLVIPWEVSLLHSIFATFITLTMTIIYYKSQYTHST